MPGNDFFIDVFLGSGRDGREVLPSFLLSTTKTTIITPTLMSENTLFRLIYLAAILVIAAIGYLLDPETYLNQENAEEENAKKLSLRQKVSAACWFITMAGLFSLIFILDDEPVQGADLYSTIYSH